MNNIKSIDNTNDLDVVQSDITDIKATAHFEGQNFDTLTGDIDCGGNIVCDGTVFAATLRSSASTGLQNQIQPAISHNSDSNSGIYFPLTDDIGFSTGGVQRMLLSNTSLNLSVDRSNTAQPHSLRRKETTQSIAENAEVTVTYDTIISEVGITYAAGVFTVPSAGFYLCIAELYYDTSAAVADFKSGRWVHSGDTSYRFGFVDDFNEANRVKRLTSTAVIKCDASDTVEFVTGHGNSGNGALNVGSVSNVNQNEISVIKLF